MATCGYKRANGGRSPSKTPDVDLQKLAGKQAHADSPCSCDPDGSGNGSNSRSCKRQAKDTVEIKHRLCAHSEDGAGAKHKKGQGSSGLAIRVWLVGRRKKGRSPSEHLIGVPRALLVGRAGRVPC